MVKNRQRPMNEEWRRFFTPFTGGKNGNLNSITYRHHDFIIL
jgi:hypothetical protein